MKTHTYYAGGRGVSATNLIEEAKRSAKAEYEGGTWELWYLDLYHGEILDEDTDKVVDEEAKVIVRCLPGTLG